MKLQISLAAGLLLVSSVGLAVAGEDLDELAMNLGKVFGSEAGCGLAYDQVAIERLIEQRVPASEHGFTSQLEASTGAAEYAFKDMTASQKTARCALAKRGAQDYGLLK